MEIPKLQDLTLREKIGQTMILSSTKLTQMEDIEAYFAANPVGALWASGGSKKRETYTQTETKAGNPKLLGRRDEMHIRLLNAVNKQMRIPILPVMDAFTGITIFDGHAGLPTATSIGAARDPELAYRQGRATGKDLHAIGCRWIWSPVADNPGRFPGLRTMTCNREENCRLLAAYIKGVQSAGVATSVKHFPGPDPRDTRDTHFCTASITMSLEDWEKTQMRDYQACLDAGVDSVMIRHATFKAVDDTRVNGALLPATLSYKIVTGLLREKMGFRGLVLTDDATMKALTAVYPEEKTYVEILRAGIDMVLSPARLDYIDIIEKAVRDGDLPESRIDEACGRVLALKEKYGLFSQGELPIPTEEERKAISDEIHAVSKAISEKGITLCANRTGFLPVKREKIKKVKIVYIGYSDACYENLRYAVEEFSRHGAVCDVQEGFEKADNETLPEYDLIVYATYIGQFAPAGGPYFFEEKCRMMRRIMTVATEKSVGVSFGNPNIFFNYFTAAHTFVNAYSFTPETMQSFVKGLYGEVQFTDFAPFPLNPLTGTNDVYG